MPSDTSIRLLHDGQLTLWLLASVTVTGAPQFGQLNWRPASSLTDAWRRPDSCNASSATGWPSVMVAGCVL